MLLDEVARSLGAPREILPYLPELFADLGALGTTPRRAVNWLASAGIGEGSCIIDLGCGKGAAAVQAAERLGCRVVGIDGFEPFVESARAHALERGVGHLCTFAAGDYRGVQRKGGCVGMRARFDAGMMLSVAPLEEAAAAMHRFVKSGGVYLIDDAVWVGPGDSEGVPSAAEAREMIESLGDHVERTHTFSPAELLRMESRLQVLIRGRAGALGRRQPELRPLIREFTAIQRSAIRMLTSGPLRPVLWMVRQGGGESRKVRGRRAGGRA